MVKRRRAQKQNSKEKKPTKTRQRKKQKTKHDDTDQEDSNSTTDLNCQSDSLYSPVSAKKPMKIDSPRRASLRLSKKNNLIETRIADLSRCSNPPRSKEHLRESPSRYLKTLRYKEIEKGGKCIAIENADEDLAEMEVPLAVSLGDLIARRREGEVGEQEEPLAEKPVNADNELQSRERSLSNGQHIILDKYEVMRARIASLNTPIETRITDLSKSRKKFSTTHAMQELHDLAFQVPQSPQVESPSRYLKLGEPSLRHEEIVEKGGKEVSLVQKAISMASVGLTEFFNRRVVDEDDDVDSQRCAMHTVEGYRVKPESMAILKEILTKYGDIAKDCTIPIMEFRSGLLETICGIILQLQGKELRQIKEDFLLHNIAQVDGMKILGVDIEWLHVLLNDILEAKQPFGEKFHKLKEQRDSNRKTIEDAKRKLRECEERKRKLSEKLREVSALLELTLDEEIVWKETLVKAEDESTTITRTINSFLSKAKRFRDCSPLDHLL